MKIGISASEGSFTEEAAHLYAEKNDSVRAEFIFCGSAESALQALEDGTVERALVPIENSNGGVVTEFLPAIAAHRFAVDRLIEMDVHHMLLVTRGKRAHDIKKIVSQRQALRQCRMYIARVWPDVEVIEYTDTAAAARDLSNGTLDDDVAVVAPRRSATLYGLDILEESIQDLKFNFTTFIVAKKLD
jgi:prephenate dehydratase